MKKQKCAKCDFLFRYVEIHHKNRDRLDNSKENLITLCLSCHQDEYKGESSYQLGDYDGYRELSNKNRIGYSTKWMSEDYEDEMNPKKISFSPDYKSKMEVMRKDWKLKNQVGSILKFLDKLK